MITIIGIFIILIGVITFFMRPFLNDEDVTRQATNRSGQSITKLVSRKSPDILLAFNWKKSLIIFLVGFIIAIIPGSYFYAQPGKAYAVQYVWGSDKAVMTQGLKVKWWGKLISISHEISIKDVLPNADVSQESKYTYILNTVKREFNDAVSGDVANTLVLQIDLSDEKKFKKVATNNRSERNLVFSRIIPYRDAVLKNTAKLMSAQDYIAGASAEFDRAYKDQMENGPYKLKEVESDVDMKDTIGVEGVVRTLDNNSKRKKYKIEYYTDSTGTVVPIRTSGSLKDLYGLKVILAVINKIDWEPEFDKRLNKQKEQVAETQLEKQLAEKAIFNRKRLYEEGEALKAKEQAAKELEQIEKTITAETKAKVAIFNLTESQTLFKKAVVDAKAIKVTADADAYRNLKLVKAGLTPQEEMSWKLKIADAVSGNIAKTKFPDVLITGGSSNGKGNETSILYDLLGAEVAKSMIPRTQTPTKKNVD